MRNPSFDPCSVGHAVVFLDEAEEGVYWLASQGFVSFESGVSAPSLPNDLFKQGAAADSVTADIRRIVSDQQARGVPRGRVLCDSWRDSPSAQDPKACPGDSFNPYEAFGLARVLEVDIRKLNADRKVLAARGDVPPDTRVLVDMLASLNQTVAVESADDPQGDVVSLKVITTTTGTLPYVAALTYEAETDSILGQRWNVFGAGGLRRGARALLEGP